MKIPSIAQLRSGPPSLDLLTAAAVLGIGRTRAYELARRGEFPVRVFRIGTSYRVPVTALLELLGISETQPAHTEARAQHLTASHAFSGTDVR
jgi:predicted DNA-binding transcriptional regulator AlpA